MSYSPDDLGFIFVILVAFGIAGIAYVLYHFVGLGELAITGLLVPLVIGSFISWVRYENAKIAAAEAAASDAAKPKEASAPAEAKKEK